MSHLLGCRFLSALLLLLLFVNLAYSYLDCGNSNEKLIHYLNLNISINCSIVGLSKEQHRCSLDHILNKLNHTDFVPIANPPKDTELSLVKTGGYFKPSCVPIQKVAIIIPYRNRNKQLPVAVHNLHKFLMLQNITEYRIIVVEQDDSDQFNRAKLLNVAFTEAIKLFGHFDCFIFHDIECIPINYANLYACSQNPRHMSYNVKGYKQFYEMLFGGVNAIAYKQVIEVNGFSNKFWGWGGEDDEMRLRLTRANYSIDRFPFQIAKYIKLKHGKDMLSDANPNRFNLLKQSATNSKWDGLNSLKYKINEVILFNLYTLMKVDLQKQFSDMK